jgi:hypothetical protein
MGITSQKCSPLRRCKTISNKRRLKNRTLCSHVHADNLQFLTLDTENDITMTAFRLLTMDLLVLFHCMNEGMVNILGKYSGLFLRNETYLDARTFLRDVQD